METRMKIGIVGAGRIGETLAKKIVSLGHTLYISNTRGAESLRDLAVRTGAVPASVKQTVQNSQIIIVAIPFKSIASLAKNLFDDVDEKVILIDTCNYYPMWRDGYSIPGFDEDVTESEWVQQRFGRPVIKAFNSITFLSLDKAGKSKGDRTRIGIPVAGDNEQAKKVIMSLVDDLGFDPVDGGKLKDSWKQQPGTSVYCKDMMASEIMEQFKLMGDERTDAIRSETINNRTAQERYILDNYAKL